MQEYGRQKLILTSMRKIVYTNMPVNIYELKSVSNSAWLPKYIVYDAIYHKANKPAPLSRLALYYRF